jgi:hypothetical protein
VGFNSEVFDVREFEASDFLTLTLVLHREKKSYLEFRQCVWGCPKGA